MKHWIATLLASVMLLSSPAAFAGSVEKKPLNLQEITMLAVEEELDKDTHAETEAGLKSGSGLIVLLIIGVAILFEAGLSFLGVGVPPTRPSLGTLIRVGNDFLFSGEWWMTIFPGAALIILVLAVNLLGDWLRDALNPKLR